MAKLDRLGWVVCNWFEIDGYRFGVRTTSPAFAEWIVHCLGAYQVDGPNDEDDEPTWAVVVEDGSSPVREGGETPSREVGRRFHILYRGTWDVVRTLDVRGVAQAFLTEIATIRHPASDDALYLEAGVAQVSGRSVLIPYQMVPGLARAVRRVQRAGVVPPGAMVTAVDPATGRLVRPDTVLDLPGDAWERLAEMFPPNGADPRVVVEDELAIDAVLMWGGPEASGLWQVSRAESVMALAGWSRNLPMLGGRGIQGLARLVSDAGCYAVRWRSTNEMIDAIVRVGAAEYAIDRSEDTPAGP